MAELRETELSGKMRQLANNGHPRASELRELALALDRVAFTQADARKLLGAWARAKRVWSECSGESLI